jgi:putative hydrolase of the HAD superfamily
MHNSVSRLFHHTRADFGVALSLRAVIFDYGMVLTGPQDPEAYATLLRLTGLERDRFEPLYWADRHAYDEGKLTGLEFWQKLLHDAGLAENGALIAELNLWDGRMWTTQNSAMLAWQLSLKQHGLKTAILSNMGDNVLANIERTFDWLPRFDVLVWSYQLKIAKPDPAIYLHTLRELNVAPNEALFLDDRLENIQADQALGMRGIIFSNINCLRTDLIAAGLDRDLPLPG